jgi:hypothetical protein
MQLRCDKSTELTLQVAKFGTGAGTAAAVTRKFAMAWAAVGDNPFHE